MLVRVVIVFVTLRKGVGIEVVAQFPKRALSHSSELSLDVRGLRG
jgi:hypothetical protein